MDDFTINITKRQKLYEENNCMCYNFYYLIHGRIINKEKTKYKKFRFVLWFDVFDLHEYYSDCENITEDMKKDFIEELIFGYTQFIKSYNDVKDFYDLCNQSIEDWNKRCN